MPICNICLGTEFVDFNGRIGIECANCNSLERHRLVRVVLEELGFLDKAACFGIMRALHLAPEKMTFNYIEPVFGAGYLASDMYPEKYQHAQALRIVLPKGLGLFPSEYFDLILHNHVLEHIPGSYKLHLDEFVRLLKPGGCMVFSLPSVNLGANTIEGGEHLPSDSDRLRIHGQVDHYKTFGKDFYEYFNGLDGDFKQASIDTDLRRNLSALADVIYLQEELIVLKSTNTFT